MTARFYRSCAIGAVFSISLSAVAADAERVERYLQLSRMDATMGQMSQIMQASSEQMLAQMASERRLDEAALKRARELALTQIAAMTEVISWEAMKAEIARVIGETLTDAELDASIAFMASPEGQSILDKQPQLMQRASEISQRRMLEVMPVMQAELRRIIDQTLKQQDQPTSTEAVD